MRRRLDIAVSLIVPPDLLFLDEPTTGLDPVSRTHVWQIVRAIVARGGCCHSNSACRSAAKPTPRR